MFGPSLRQDSHTTWTPFTRKYRSRRRPAASTRCSPTIAARIGREAGAPFAIFGGFIVGRNIERVADTRLVEGWSLNYWQPMATVLARL